MSQASGNIAPASTENKGTDAAPSAKVRKAGKPATMQKPQAPARRTQGARQGITLADAGRQAPTHDMMSKLYRLFGMEPVDVDGIAAATEASLVQQSEDLRSALSDKAMEMHFQRIVGAYVGSAFGAAQFFDSKRAIARDMASKMNDDRDEDRDGPSGFESRVERAQSFAAEMARQSYATLAAAEGAVRAFETITGNAWKPYVASTPESQSVGRQAAQARASAFD
ncbi:hypothetical protein [Roseomonas mucosa]